MQVVTESDDTPGIPLPTRDLRKSKPDIEAWDVWPLMSLDVTQGHQAVTDSHGPNRVMHANKPFMQGHA